MRFVHEHLTRELFRAVSTGWRNPGDLAAIAMAHLFELCPECRREFESWREELQDRETPASTGADYGAVLDRIRARVERPDGGREESPLEREIREARSHAEELLRLTSEQQLDWIRSERERRTGPLLAEVLIEEALRRTPGNPHDGYNLTQLARVVLHHCPASLHTAKLYARALAYMANAVRILGDLPRADQLLADSRFVLRFQGGGDRLVQAELNQLEGSLRRHQGRPRHSVALLLRAQAVYCLEGLEEKTIATLLLLSRAHLDLTEFARALQLLNEAERRLENHHDDRLLLAAASRRVATYHKSYQLDQALDMFVKLEEINQEYGDSISTLRVGWLKSRLLGALGEVDETEGILLNTIEALSDHKMVSDVASAQYDLAQLLFDQGRYSESETFAERAASVFEEIGLSTRAERCHQLLLGCRSGGLP